MTNILTGWRKTAARKEKRRFFLAGGKSRGRCSVKHHHHIKIRLRSFAQPLRFLVRGKSSRGEPGSGVNLEKKLVSRELRKRRDFDRPRSRERTAIAASRRLRKPQFARDEVNPLHSRSFSRGRISSSRCFAARLAAVSESHRARRGLESGGERESPPECTGLTTRLSNPTNRPSRPVTGSAGNFNARRGSAPEENAWVFCGGAFQTRLGGGLRFRLNW